MNIDLDAKRVVKHLRHLEQLLLVIQDVHAQHADDLCWMPADVNRIFEAAGLPPQDLYVGDKAAMLANCERYVACLQSGGGWLSYADLEAENERLRDQVAMLEREQIVRVGP